MPTRTDARLADLLRHSRLLDEDQLGQLSGDLLRQDDALAAELVARGWLTPYQLAQLSQGKGDDLVLGPYVLLERLGEGGMGTVFKARDRRRGRVVALKLIRKERLADEDAVRRFRREIRAATALDHPNVVRAGAEEINGTHLLVMEYVEGTDLARLVRQNGPMPVAEACDCVRQAALGLQHAHERGLVHRDIKPANLMRTPDGVVKVLDLGLARLAHPEGDERSGTMTAEGAFMGTPDYVAPEQALESHAVDIRADLYSLGCTLFFLLTGRVPFLGRTLMDKLLRHQLRAPPPVEEFRPEVPPAVARVVRKLMAKRPEDRYQAPAELAAVLAAGGEESVAPGDETRTVIRGDRATIRPPAGPVVSQRRSGQKHRRRRYAVAGGLLLLAGVAAWWLSPKPPAGPPRPEDTETDRRPSAPPADRVGAKNDEAWLGAVAALPAPKQVEAVAAELRRRNPGFDGDVTPTIEDGVVTGLRFKTDHVTDLSPVRALAGLRRLDMGGTRGEGLLADLSPLAGMRLTVLDCSGSRVADLSPLRGMKLKELNLWYTPVADLSPLRGMRLAVLGCGGTEVADLSPLRGTELYELNVWGTPVSDLSPLEGMKLRTLACGMTRVTDLSPLRGMPLRTLHCDHTAVRDLSPLRGMKLIRLSCEQTRVTDLSPLRDMPLRTMWCDLRDGRDVETLRTLTKLEKINTVPAAQFWKKLEREPPGP